MASRNFNTVRIDKAMDQIMRHHHMHCSPFPHDKELPVGFAKALTPSKPATKAVAPAAVALLVLQEVLAGFIPHITTLVVGIIDKIVFDCDPIGRKRTIMMMEENARAGYARRNKNVNIAIWNMHLHEDHQFEDIIESGIVPMGKGGGFRIVTFLGSGWIRNHGARGFENWCCSGNQWQDDNLITFGKR